MYVKINDWKEAVFILMVLGLFFFMISKLYLKEFAYREGKRNKGVNVKDLFKSTAKNTANAFKSAAKNTVNVFKSKAKKIAKKTVSAFKNVSKKEKKAREREKAKNRALDLLLARQKKFAKQISALKGNWNKIEASIPTIAIGNIVERQNNYVQFPRARGKQPKIKNLVPMIDIKGSVLPTILINAVIPFSMKGERGEKGEKGETGIDGLKGDKGQRGIDGHFGEEKNRVYCPRQ
jgi:hypothetical protein